MFPFISLSFPLAVFFIEYYDAFFAFHIHAGVMLCECEGTDIYIFSSIEIVLFRQLPYRWMPHTEERPQDKNNHVRLSAREERGGDVQIKTRTHTETLMRTLLSI